ncbi:hypothetical protein BDZ90DRAFT_231675 [Jaminaea rosea]|uniref:RING-type domain-containing protein n=1 Tax=Jaminaea rosea TaxID=1569628 RepID=A0A316URF5_9BASI|nr:hypothetical protein BDZ90DRAFT_231675 [Jaminaea rosea]PWN27900.1 hypothetical protein BDZ90DRAFT_231675 [Jaminaea rosea]
MPVNNVADQPPAAWRSLPFFQSLPVSAPSSSLASQRILAIKKLTNWPRGIQDDSRTKDSVTAPYLVILKSGDITVVDSTTFAPLTSSFASLSGAHGSLTHAHFDTASSRFILLSEDDGAAGTSANANLPLMRIWDVSDPRSKQWRPRLLAETRIQHGRTSFPVAALASTPGLTYLACSLSNGAVLLLRNLSAVLDAAPSNAPTAAMPKFKVVMQPASSSEKEPVEPVTALAFSSIDSPATLHLFIANLSKVTRYTVLGKGAGSPAITLDHVGAPLDCSALVPARGDETPESKLLIARPEAIYVIGSNGREACYAHEGQKAKVFLLPASLQLVILSPPVAAKTTAARTSAPDTTEVAIFDLQGKFLSYQGSVLGAIQAVFSDPTTFDGREDVYVLTDADNLHRLEERPLREKLDLLYSRSLFVLAAQVARSHFASAHTDSPDATTQLNALLAEIWIKHGDHLYEKGDYEGSMKMGYLKSVPATAASGSRRVPGSVRKSLGESYIIRRFLDAQRIPLLTLYLQELHRRGLANPDHTTLLLNCFTKMRDTEALDRFIRRSHVISNGADDGDDEDDYGSIVSDVDDEAHQDRLPFDLATAIKVCRSANYFAQASYLAKKFDLGAEYLRIKIEDTNSPLEALDWLRSRDAADVDAQLRLYAGLLLAGGDEAEEATTDLLVELCSGAYRPRVSNSTAAIEQAARAAARGETAAKNDGAGVLGYLKGGGGSVKSASGKPFVIPGVDEELPAEEENAGPAYDIPSPRTFFPYFLRFTPSFRRFLETVALARWAQSIADEAPEDLEESTGSAYEQEAGDDNNEDDDDDDDDDDVREQKSIWNTLFEIYLQSSDQEDHSRAVRLLRQHKTLPYDVAHTLVLCEQASFIQGVVILYERMGMFEDVVRLWMDRAHEELARGDTPESAEEVLAALKRYGHIDDDSSSSASSLHSLVLSFLVSHPVLLSRHRGDVESLLLHIEDRRIMSTLELVDLLSKSGPHADIGLVKSFLQRTVAEETSEMEADERLIASYRGEARAKTKEIADLSAASGEPRVFQSNRCHACGGQIDLPAVHFMCKHSYHARCLGEKENECPSCARSFGVIREIRTNNAELASRHDLFLQELDEADDPFETIASMFSRGIFTKVALQR